jgi:hypothetical protein
MKKKGNSSKMGNKIYFKIAQYVDLDMLNMFAISNYHLSLIVFEIKDVQKLSEIKVKFKLQKCAACQDLPTLQF